MAIDEGSQLVKGCESMRLTFTDIKDKLHKDTMVTFDTYPVGGHNYNGKVERKIRHIRESLDKSCQNKRLSTLQWEIVASEIANAVNDLPLPLGNIVSNYENMGLLTPNRLLKLGKNNERSLVSPFSVSGNISEVVNMNKKIFNTWFETQFVSHMPKLMHQPKWFQSNCGIEVCDIALFRNHESTMTQISRWFHGLFWQFIPCNYHMQSPVLLQNIFKFCTFLPKFSNIFPFFNISVSFFLKNCTHALTF